MVKFFIEKMFYLFIKTQKKIGERIANIHGAELISYKTYYIDDEKYLKRFRKRFYNK